MDCEKCFEVFASTEEFSEHVKGHYGAPSLIPAYYSKTDFNMGRDYPGDKKLSWLSGNDMKRLLHDTFGASG
jgi:hypothetical protein